MLDNFFELFIQDGMEILAWVILPNHYHLLVNVCDFSHLGGLFRSIHGKTSYAWNKEERVSGRKVWYRFTDRAIRSERHFYTSINYIHYNPVKHKWIKSPYDWKASSVHWYLEHEGREWLRKLWVNFPVKDYGQGWDDFNNSEEIPEDRLCF